MKTYEATGKTYEEALQNGLIALGVTISDVNIDLVEEGSKGLFGLFGSRPYKVRLTVKEEAEDDPLADLFAKPEPKKEKKPVEKKPEQPKAEKKPAEKREPKPEVKPIEKPVVTMIPADQVDADSAAGKAQAFLKELTQLMGVDVEVAVGTDAENNVFVQMTGDTLGILIGRRGETLDALQYLTSLKVNRGKDDYTRVTLDTENYRAKREDTLIRLANRMANRAVKTGRKVSLEPMNPYERRIIHSALQANDAVDTHSEGDEPNRHVVITLRK